MDYKNLIYEPEYVFDKLTDEQKEQMENLCTEYRNYLDLGKTERECVDVSVAMAEKNGFTAYDGSKKLKAGDKVYIINRNKNILLAVMGEEPLTEGISLVGAHVDSPRLDLKQRPLYESCNMSLLKTHYYGGIKKYQWMTIPLALHGVVYTKSGKCVNITIGEDENDPVFCVTDLLPHLAKDQMTKKMSEVFDGEMLNILFGGFTISEEDEKDRFKKNILRILFEKYGMTERDFLSAEIEAVPAYKAKNVGLDGAFIGAYGQDDRVCAYTALKAIFEVENPSKTAVCLFVDKEEIGSCGNTGMLSGFFKTALAELAENSLGSCDYLTLCKIIEKSACLSSDVSAAVDPGYEQVSEKMNAAFAGCGMVLMKYTGARGKYDSSDASAEFVHTIGDMLDKNNVYWQTGELGKVDQGGGGTIAQYVANLNMDVIDCGVPVLSMHAPFEVTAKTDVYMAYLSYKAFYKEN